ncbi:small G protein signaling modulator 1-like isoform X2 [Panthera pardus]|uniref:Small G protein signaling modulator 1-like isoform X2 n=1 Tax=Panthera pardus TaxID=9691 RepID=A0A9W2W3J9_PANPR|nr:small G protein signaling modulator 1-like isoform X2 [Panthera pardus]
MCKYYEKEALLMDPADGPILASLLVGPRALEYTEMKTADHFWTDPSADELVQRHRIHSSHLWQDSATKRQALCIQKRHSSGSTDDRPSLSARDCVESLHQNSRATLLYGKNDVLVQPVVARAMENGVAKVKKQQSHPVMSHQAVGEVATGAMEYGVPKEEKVWAVRVRRHQGVAEDLVSRMKKKKCSPEVKNIHWHQAVLQKTPHLANNRRYSINDPIECIF